MKIWEWIKINKLTVLLLIIIAYLALSNQPRLLTTINRKATRLSSPNYYESEIADSALTQEPLGSAKTSLISDGAPPAPEVSDRLVIQHSNLSLLVKNVKEETDKIIKYAQDNGGYMVNSSLKNPEENATATITIRIPAKNLTSALDFFRNTAVKVVSENLTGRDVTDQYVDIEERLSTLYKTKAKFEEILNSAAKVEDILKVQREIINLQNQIDSLKGQQKYMEKSAEMVKITIYLATDEFALPYTPSESWRPNVIFKNAVRSMITTLRSIGKIAIWVGVYSVVWIPALVAFYLIRKRLKKKNL